MKLSEKILYLRKKQGMTQEQLAEKMEVSRQAGFPLGEWDFPKLKKPPTNPRLHYFQYEKSKIYWRYYYGSELNLHSMW